MLVDAFPQTLSTGNTLVDVCNERRAAQLWHGNRWVFMLRVQNQGVGLGRGMWCGGEGSLMGNMQRHRRTDVNPRKFITTTLW